MAATRVGVLTHDSSLVVDLALRASGMAIVGVTDSQQFADCQVALVDVASGEGAAEILAAIPDGPAVVVLCNGPFTVTPEMGRVTVVERPCSLSDVLEAITTARQIPVGAGVGGPSPVAVPPPMADPPPPEPPMDDDPANDELVIVLDRPDPGPFAPAVRTIEQEIPATDPPSGAEGEHAAVAVPRTAGPLFEAPPPVVEPAPAPTPELEPALWVRKSSHDQLADWIRDREPGISSDVFRDEVAGRIAQALDADSVVLWAVEGDDFTVRAGMGITDAARQARIPIGHPVVRLARGADGVYLRNPKDLGARAPGFPGSGSRAYAVIVAADESAPIAMLTIGGLDLPSEAIDLMKDLMPAIAEAWRSRQSG